MQNHPQNTVDVSHLSWLDRIIAEQANHSSLLYGSPTAVSDAAMATDYFTDDQLEAPTHRNWIHNL